MFTWVWPLHVREQLLVGVLGALLVDLPVVHFYFWAFPSTKLFLSQVGQSFVSAKHDASLRGQNNIQHPWADFQHNALSNVDNTTISIIQLLGHNNQSSSPANFRISAPPNCRVICFLGEWEKNPSEGGEGHGFPQHASIWTGVWGSNWTNSCCLHFGFFSMWPCMYILFIKIPEILVGHNCKVFQRDYGLEGVEICGSIQRKRFS